jgi:hypothetical protein
MKTILRKTIIVAVFALSFSYVSAQPPGGPGGGGTGNPSCFPPPCVPIDGGISWLLLAGAVYGGKKVYEMNNKKVDE